MYFLFSFFLFFFLSLNNLNISLLSATTCMISEKSDAILISMCPLLAFSGFFFLIFDFLIYENGKLRCSFYGLMLLSSLLVLVSSPICYLVSKINLGEILTDLSNISAALLSFLLVVSLYCIYYTFRCLTVLGYYILFVLICCLFYL